jgi:hypothetical protein
MVMGLGKKPHPYRAHGACADRVVQCEGPLPGHALQVGFRVQPYVMAVGFRLRL